MSRPISVLELRSVRGTGGGPEKTILLGAEQRNRARFDVTVCYIRDLRDEIFGIDARAGHMDVDYVEVRERHSFDPAIWRTLKDVVRDKHIDIVHAHDYKTIALALGLCAGGRAIALATAHGWTGHSARERLVYYPLAKRLLARFPRVIAVSGEIRDDLIRHGARGDRVTVLLNGIDPAAFHRVPAERDAIRHELGYQPKDVVIGSVGRLEPQKRFDLQFDALAALLPAYPNLRLAIVGDGSLREELTALAARLNLGDRCVLLGHRDDIAHLHHAFDVFVQSSDYEGTPNSVLEAMAMETPIIATDAGGTRELALPGMHALIIPSGNVSAIRDALVTVLTDPAGAKSRVAAARRRVETELSFERRTRVMEQMYEDLFLARAASASGAAIASQAPHA